MNANHIIHAHMRDFHMHISQLRVFVALVETGSFTEAAYSINLTQSAVSHALATLEKELGVTLLERDRQGKMQLSTVGHKILRQAQEILAHVETIQQEAALELSQVEGKLRVGSSQIVPPRQIAGILAHFKEQYPKVDVLLFEGTGPEVYEWINAGLVDVGFVHLDGKDSAITLVTTGEIHILLPEAHPLLQKKTISLKGLREEHLIMPKSECDFLVHLGLASHRGKVNISYQASDSTTIIAMVREGLGIALLPRMLLPEKLEGVQAVPLNPPEYMLLGLATTSQVTASPATDLFIQDAQTWSQAHGFLQRDLLYHDVKVQAREDLVEHAAHS
jgi:DNA-binding transcriptional LysR family regulator